LTDNSFSPATPKIIVAAPSPRDKPSCKASKGLHLPGDRALNDWKPDTINFESTSPPVTTTFLYLPDSRHILATRIAETPDIQAWETITGVLGFLKKVTIWLAAAHKLTRSLSNSCECFGSSREIFPLVVEMTKSVSGEARSISALVAACLTEYITRRSKPVYLMTFANVLKFASSFSNGTNAAWIGSGISKTFSCNAKYYLHSFSVISIPNPISILHKMEG
jgi:hypothetical protein